MNDRANRSAPILADKHHAAPSAFTPQNLLREARRQKSIATANVPAVCVLDPDGDMVRQLRREGRAHPDPGWACYHTELYRTAEGGIELGLIGCAVGAPFAVLIAEQLFASGCELLISMTSAGQLVQRRPPPYFIIIYRALRDEGTSYHYAPPAEFAFADATLVRDAAAAAEGAGLRVLIGASWTTDAPFRETAHAIEAARARGVLAVEMEAAALYALAGAKAARVLCIAHVTNTMGLAEQDFEKGEANGTGDALKLLAAIVGALG